jgi:hypothetical protein
MGGTGVEVAVGRLVAVAVGCGIVVAVGSIKYIGGRIRHLAISSPARISRAAIAANT